jgi:hypothetical protein
MIALKHTPGPWTAEKRKDRKIREWSIRAKSSIHDCGSYELASLSGYDPHRDKANARLISAAPDLLEALRKAVERQGFTNDELIEARSIISKAMGSQK